MLPTLDIQVRRTGNLSRRVGSDDLDKSDVFRSGIEQAQYVGLLVNVVRDDAPISWR